VWICVLCEATSAGTAVVRAPRKPYCQWCADEMQRTGRRYCPRCKASVPIAEMTTGMCKAHNRERFAAYRAKHADLVRERNRANRTPERKTARRVAQIRAAQARYCLRHRDRVLAQRRRWRACNPGRYKRYYWTNADACRARRKHQRFEKKLAILRGWR
jgi:hypothetical protein